MEALFAWVLTTPYAPYVMTALSVMGGLMMIASAIVPLTKTPKDDEILGKIKSVFDRFSLFAPKPK